jgi:integrase
MARIRQRKRADGGVTYQVCWVLGGGSAGNGAKEQYESFTNPKRSEAFRLEVEEAGHRWPAGWVKCQGYVTTPRSSTARSRSTRWLIGISSPVRRRVARRSVEGPTRCIATSARGRCTWSRASAASPRRHHRRGHLEWIDDQLDAGAAPKSIRNRHGILYSAVQPACSGASRRQSVRDTELPGWTHAARQIRFFTHAEWSTFPHGLKDDVLLLCDYLLATGLRWGEVSALRIGDLSIKDRDVSLPIIRGWSGRSPDDTDEIDWAAGEAKWKLGPPRTSVARVRRRHRGRRASCRTCIGGDYATNICSRAARPLAVRGLPLRAMEAGGQAAKPASTRLAPHMLRHTCVVWSLAEGVRIEQVSEMLGHASIQITYDVYGGLLDLEDPAVARAMAVAMARS